MQIALVAVVLLAGMWFTVLKPKSDTGTDSGQPAATPAAATGSDPVAPGVKGLATAVDKAKAAAAKSDAANAKVQAATGGDAAGAAATPAKRAAATKAARSAAAAAKSGTKVATAKAAAAAGAAVDPSDRLLAYVSKGKVLVILFEGKGFDDQAARTAVHRTAARDRKHVVSAYVPIEKVGKYEAITSGVQILTAPTVLVIGKDRKATALTGYVDAASVRQAVGDARRVAAASSR
ncbi:MAG TPA: hypothetical protein VNT03_04745 [Baekduia sp.]|nr:hypothetical protein [Baekduia sp.]